MHTIKKALITACATAVFAGCGGDSSVSNPAGPGTNIDQPVLDFQPGTYPLFNPAASELPTNNDLLFLSAASELGADFDGTADVGSATNPAEAAINDLDGFSTSAYFHIKFAGGSINPGTVCTNLAGCPGPLPPNVFLIPLVTETGGDPLDPADLDTDGSEGGPFDGGNIPAISAEVVDLDGGTDNALRIIPEETLLPATKYLVFVTDMIQDSEGNQITPSFQYNLLSDPTAEVGSALQSVQTILTQVWDPLANGFLAQNPGDPGDDIPGNVAISYTFTTTDPHKPLVAMAEPRAALLAAGVPAGSLPAFTTLSTPEPRPLDIKQSTGVDLNNFSSSLAAGVGELFTGYIELPQYLGVPATQGGTDFSFLSQFWRGDQTVAGTLEAGGTNVPEDTDGTLNVTYRFPFAGENAAPNFPLQVTMPVPTHEPDPSGSPGMTCADVKAGNNGYPVVIYVHGITSDRTSVIALGHSLASACVATVAIDLPLHGVPANADPALIDLLNVDRATTIPYGTVYSGVDIRERHFEVVQDSVGNPTVMDFSSPGELDGSGAWFINLGTLQTTRDNLRQAVMDLLNLNASMAALSQKNLDGDGDTGTPLFNLNQVKVVGVSLGGIVSTVFGMVNEQAIANASAATLPSDLNPLQGVVVSAGGSQLTQILNNSPTFAPRIQAGLAANGVNVGTSDYESFLFVAQSTVASGDPVNFAQALAATGMPVVVQQVVGGGDASGLGDTKTYLPDQVVPNSAAGAPLAGTTPLANLLGTQVPASGDVPGTVDVDAQNTLINLTIGHHASLLRPNEESGVAPTNGELLATSELQTEVVSFVSDATAMAVGTASSGTAANFVETQ